MNCVWLMFASFLFAIKAFSSTQNSHFDFNQKNLNAISSLVCSLHSSLSAESGRADEQLYYHKFRTIDKSHSRIHVVGLCKASSWKLENNFELKSRGQNLLVGYVDEYKFKVYFKNIKRIHNNKIKEIFVLDKITMFPSPSLLPDGLADFLEPSLEKISVQKIIPYKASWHWPFEDSKLEFRSDEFNRSLLGFVLYETERNILFLDAVPAISFHTGKYRKETDKAQAVFINSHSSYMYGCSQFTDSTSSQFKIKSNVCRSLHSRYNY